MLHALTTEKCPECGGTMGRDLVAEQEGRRDTPGTYPMTSYAAGISPDEVKEFEKSDAAAGVPTEYTKGPDGGDPIFTSAKHRKKYCRLHELYDRNAGYSDPVPVNR